MAIDPRILKPNKPVGPSGDVSKPTPRFMGQGQIVGGQTQLGDIFGQRPRVSDEEQQWKNLSQAAQAAGTIAQTSLQISNKLQSNSDADVFKKFEEDYISFQTNKQEGNTAYVIGEQTFDLTNPSQAFEAEEIISVIDPEQLYSPESQRTALNNNRKWYQRRPETIEHIIESYSQKRDTEILTTASDNPNRFASPEGRWELTRNTYKEEQRKLYNLAKAYPNNQGVKAALAKSIALESAAQKGAIDHNLQQHQIQTEENTNSLMKGVREDFTSMITVPPVIDPLTNKRNIAKIFGENYGLSDDDYNVNEAANMLTDSGMSVDARLQYVSTLVLAKIRYNHLRTNPAYKNMDDNDIRFFAFQEAKIEVESYYKRNGDGGRGQRISNRAIESSVEIGYEGMDAEEKANYSQQAKTDEQIFSPYFGLLPSFARGVLNKVPDRTAAIVSKANEKNIPLYTEMAFVDNADNEMGQNFRPKYYYDSSTRHADVLLDTERPLSKDTINSIAKSLGTTPKELEEAGYLEREEDTDPNVPPKYHVTDKGKQKLSKKIIEETMKVHYVNNEALLTDSQLLPPYLNHLSGMFNTTTNGRDNDIAAFNAIKPFLEERIPTVVWTQELFDAWMEGKEFIPSVPESQENALRNNIKSKISKEMEEAFPRTRTTGGGNNIPGLSSGQSPSLLNPTKEEIPSTTTHVSVLEPNGNVNKDKASKLAMVATDGQLGPEAQATEAMLNENIVSVQTQFAHVTFAIDRMKKSGFISGGENITIQEVLQWTSNEKNKNMSLVQIANNSEYFNTDGSPNRQGQIAMGVYLAKLPYDRPPSDQEKKLFHDDVADMLVLSSRTKEDNPEALEKYMNIIRELGNTVDINSRDVNNENSIRLDMGLQSEERLTNQPDFGVKWIRGGEKENSDALNVLALDRMMNLNSDNLDESQYFHLVRAIHSSRPEREASVPEYIRNDLIVSSLETELQDSDDAGFLGLILPGGRVVAPSPPTTDKALYRNYLSGVQGVLEGMQQGDVNVDQMRLRPAHATQILKSFYNYTVLSSAGELQADKEDFAEVGMGLLVAILDTSYAGSNNIIVTDEIQDALASQDIDVKEGSTLDWATTRNFLQTEEGRNLFREGGSLTYQVVEKFYNNSRLNFGKKGTEENYLRSIVSLSGLLEGEGGGSGSNDPNKVINWMVKYRLAHSSRDTRIVNGMVRYPTPYRDADGRTRQLAFNVPGVPSPNMPSHFAPSYLTVGGWNTIGGEYGDIPDEANLAKAPHLTGLNAYPIMYLHATNAEYGDQEKAVQTQERLYYSMLMDTEEKKYIGPASTQRNKELRNIASSIASDPKLNIRDKLILIQKNGGNIGTIPLYDKYTVDGAIHLHEPFAGELDSARDFRMTLDPNPRRDARGNMRYRITVEGEGIRVPGLLGIDMMAPLEMFFPEELVALLDPVKMADYHNAYYAEVAQGEPALLQRDPDIEFDEEDGVWKRKTYIGHPYVPTPETVPGTYPQRLEGGPGQGGMEDPRGGGDHYNQQSRLEDFNDRYTKTSTVEYTPGRGIDALVQQAIVGGAMGMVPDKKIIVSPEVKKATIGYLIEMEGFISSPTKIANETKFTVGYGHVLDGGDRSRKAFAEALPNLNYNSLMNGKGRLTKDQANKLLSSDLPKYLERARDFTEYTFKKDPRTGKVVKGKAFDGLKFEDHSDNLQKQIISATFRGSWGGSPKTRQLLAEGEYELAAKEFLNNGEYRKAKNDPNSPKKGIVKRMNAVAQALLDEGEMNNGRV